MAKAGFTKILDHPESENIIRMLNEGESVRKVEKYLKEKYPNNKKLAISTVTLQKFRSEYLQLEGRVLKDIQEQKEIVDRQIAEQDKLEAIQSTNAYQEKINAIADTHLDVANKILQLDAVIGDRMEYWFNALKSNEANPSLADKEMRQWMDRQMALMSQYKKLVEGMADKTIDHNINITVFNDQVTAIREAVAEVLSEMSYEYSMLFMDKLNDKLARLDYSSPEKEGLDNKVLEAISVETLEEDNV